VNWDQIQSEQDACESYSALLAQARKCQELYVRAGLALPDRVQRLLGVTSDSGAKTTPRIPPPEKRSPPKEAGADWIAINASDAIVTTVVLAILRNGNGGRTRVKDLNDRVMELLPESTSGSVANAGTRLTTDRVIDRDEEGWRLLKPERAAVLQDGVLWGLVAVFSSQEIAAHRRAAELHVLKQFPSGLQMVQIVEQLKSCEWVRSPVNKDMVKGDVMALLEEKKVRRVGNTKKWQLAPEKGE
jgi:hypothetical protein